jgi:chromate transporter
VDRRGAFPPRAQLLHAAAGPEAQQLATYIGWLLHKTKGGLVAGSPVRAARLRRDHGAQLDLRAASAMSARSRGCSSASRRRCSRSCSRRCVRIGQPRAEATSDAGCRRGRVRRHLLVRRALPADRARAGLIGFAGRAAGFPPLQGGGGGHGPAARRPCSRRRDALGEELPEHAAQASRWSLALVDPSSCCSCGWPVARSSPGGAGQRLHPHRSSSPRWRW